VAARQFEERQGLVEIVLPVERGLRHRFADQAGRRQVDDPVEPLRRQTRAHPVRVCEIGDQQIEPLRRPAMAGPQVVHDDDRVTCVAQPPATAPPT